jgi:hypothetical protein
MALCASAPIARHLMCCWSTTATWLTVPSRAAGITHRAVNLSEGVRVAGTLHVQNVHVYHSRFKEWLRRFDRVASHYLPNYLG